jgi:hypothetical protein
MVSDRRQRVARIVWTVLFLAGVAAIPVLNKRTLATAPSAAGTGGDGRFGFHLQDVRAKSGVDFVHQPPEFDPQLGHIMPQVASTGASVAGGRLRSRRLAGLLPDQQRRQLAQPACIATAATAASPTSRAARRGRR